jgi:hypothetical protein
MRHWGITLKKTNPPNTMTIPNHLDYFQRYVMDSVYIRRQTGTEFGRTHKGRIYETLQYYNNKAQEMREMRVLQTNPGKEWKTIWKNLHSAPITEGQKAGWCKIIHDLQAVNFRLHKIRMSNTDKCAHCGATDTTLHRYTECQERRRMWEWTACKLTVILRTGTYRISPEGTITRTCDIWPRVRRKSTLWLLAQLMTFQPMIPGRSTLSEYITCVKQNKTRLYKNRNRKDKVANYLCVVDEGDEVRERVSEYEKKGWHTKCVVNYPYPVSVPKSCKRQISRGAMLLTILWLVVLYIIHFSYSCNGTIQISMRTAKNEGWNLYH